MSHATPPLVALVSQLSFPQRSIPPQGAHITTSELQSLTIRLRQLSTLSGRLADTVEGIRSRAEAQHRAARGAAGENAE